MDPYLVLLRVGFTIATPVASRAVRSYRTFSPLPESDSGGFLSAALSVSSHSPGVTWRSDPLEPGLSSVSLKYSDRLTDSMRH